MMYSSWVYLPHYTIKLLTLSGILGDGGGGGGSESAAGSRVGIIRDDDSIHRSEF
jgi:hypothetical protein